MTPPGDPWTPDPVGSIVPGSTKVTSPVSMLTIATRPSGSRTVCSRSVPVARARATSASDWPVSPLTCTTVEPFATYADPSPSDGRDAE